MIVNSSIGLCNLSFLPKHPSKKFKNSKIVCGNVPPRVPEPQVIVASSDLLSLGPNFKQADDHERKPNSLCVNSVA